MCTLPNPRGITLYYVLPPSTRQKAEARRAAFLRGGRDDRHPLPSIYHGDEQTNSIQFILFVCSSQVQLHHRHRRNQPPSSQRPATIKSTITATSHIRSMVAVTSRKTASYRWSSIIICFLLTARGLVSGVYHAAKAGRLLPRLTVMIPFHAIVHWAILGSVDSHVGSSFPLAINNYSRQISLHFIIINLWLNAVGYAFLVLMYRHSVQTIFNRNIPRLSSVIDDDGCIPPAPHPALESFNTHLLLLRPLEILFRFVTAPLRVLPDVIVLGETRCGTTNLCGHIVNLSSNLCQSPDDRVKIKCYTPFCAWNVPDLNHKESFYFVGHYLGM